MKRISILIHDGVVDVDLIEDGHTIDNWTADELTLEVHKEEE